MLGELPVNRTQAYFAHRKHLSNFCRSRFCKRACLHCLIEGDTLVLDSEWHWIFDCAQFVPLRHNYPYLYDIIASSRSTDRGFAKVADLVCLLEKVQYQYRAGVSLGSFVRQAITIRENWMKETCARGRPCVPPSHWQFNMLESPPCDADFPVEVADNFDDGQPWFNVMDGL